MSKHLVDSPWGRWFQGSPSCWILWSFCAFNCAPWSPSWASAVLVEWMSSWSACLAVSCSLDLPAPTGCWQMCSSPGETDPGSPSWVWQLPTLQIPHGHQNRWKLLGSDCFQNPWWLWELHLCNELIESPWDLQFKVWIFAFALKEFVSILHFLAFFFFALCTSASALEAGTLWSERNKLVWSEMEQRRASPLPSPRCLCVMWAVPFPTTPPKTALQSVSSHRKAFKYESNDRSGAEGEVKMSVSLESDNSVYVRDKQMHSCP